MSINQILDHFFIKAKDKLVDRVFCSSIFDYEIKARYILKIHFHE